LPIQYIDRTKALRQHTFCSKGIVGHVSLAHPVDRFLAKQAKEILSDTDFTIHFDKTYVCIEGPTFSTQAESHQYRQLGADVIGMTGFPEVALAREAGLYYLPFSFVTDYDSWDDTIEHVTLAQVLEVMRKNNAKAFALIQKIIPQTHQLVTKGCAEQGLKNGLMTPMASLSPEVQSWLQILTQ
jgi:5'-methylthioadenosine phosphorylase